MPVWGHLERIAIIDQEFSDFAKNYETVKIVKLLIEALFVRFKRMARIAIVYFDVAAIERSVDGNCSIDFIH